MKYVMLQTPDGQKIPIIFPDFMVHELVSKAVIHMLWRQHGIEDVKAVSAGDVDFEDVSVSGHSETLGLSSKEEDAATIFAHDYLHGY